jgi:hypothetical protein
MSHKESSWKQKINPALMPCIEVIVTILDAATAAEEHFLRDHSVRISDSDYKNFKIFYEAGAVEWVLQSLMRNIISIVMMQFRGGQADLIKEVEKLVNIFESGKFEMLESNALKDIINATEFENMFDSEMILCVHFLVMCVGSAMVHKKPLKLIYKEAKEGDMKSLYKLLQIDKTIIDHEWFKELVLKASIMDDMNFFKTIGNAIKTDLPVKRLKHNRVQLILFLFWKLGLNKLTNPELVKLLEKCGFEIHYDIESFRRRITNPVKSFYRKYNSIL